jgi:hypothetical protein
MWRAIRGLAPIVTSLVLMVTPAIGWDGDWTAVTLTRTGSWGVATSSSQAQAIAVAIRDCKAMAGPQSDCGAQFATVRDGWVIAELCGDYKIIVAARSHREAEQAAIDRQIDLQLFYVPDLPACRRLLTVDPSGALAMPMARQPIGQNSSFGHSNVQLGYPVLKDVAPTGQQAR